MTEDELDEMIDYFQESADFSNELAKGKDVDEFHAGLHEGTRITYNTVIEYLLWKKWEKSHPLPEDD
jgi:hypothetical protein